jgi:hypothetical protein
MTKEQTLALKKEKLNKLQNTSKNLKCPGVLRKLRREVKNLEASM